MKKTAVVGMLVGVLCGPSVGAMLGEGTRDVTVSGSLMERDSTRAEFALTGGYFIRHALEVGGAMELVTSGSEYTRTHLGGLIEWNWDTKLPVVPYVGTYLGVVYASAEDKGSDMALELSGWAGAKCFVVENLAFGVQFQMWLATDDVYMTGTDDYGRSEGGIVLRTCFYF